MPALILASNSPRRRELLAWTGWDFSVSPVAIDETAQPGEDPPSYVSRLAHTKGEVRASQTPTGSLILSADTIVADQLTLLGKPVDRQDAVNMLQRLRGHSHQVYTAIELISSGTLQSAADRCASNVPMRNYTDAEIDSYVASGDPLDKAGAYAIQHPGFHPVEDFRGCFASVMGLPLCHLVRNMARLGYTAPVDVPGTCQANLNYACPVTAAILRGETVG